MNIVYFICYVILLYLLYVAYTAMKKVKRFQHLPGPGLKYLTTLVKKDPSQFPDLFTELGNEFGSGYCLWLGHHPAVIFTDIASIREVQLRSYGDPYKKGVLWESFAPAFGFTTVSLDHKAMWSRNRTIMQKFLTGFTTGTSNLITATVQQSHLLIEKYKKMGPNAEVDIYHDLQILMLRILYVAGIELEPSDALLEEILSIMDWLFGQAPMRVQSPAFIRDYLPPGRRYVQQSDKLKAIARGIIEEVRTKRALKVEDGADTEESREKNIHGSAKSHMEMLLDWTDEDGKPMSQVELEDETVGLLTGFDNTSTSITWMAHLLSQNLYEQRELHDSVVLDNLAPEYNPSHTNFDYMTKCSKLWNNKYLNGCYKETLRLYPPSAMTIRECVKDDMIGETLVPKGAVVIVVPYAEYRNPSVFPFPDRFDPLRWQATPGTPLSTPEPLRKRASSLRALDREQTIEDNVLFFGAGPRSCPGRRFAPMAGKIFIAMLLTQFQILPPSDPKDCIKGYFNKMALSPPGAVKLRLVPRKAN